MAKPGPKTQPTKLKILRNNPGRRPLNDNEPDPDTEAPAMPKGRLDDVAKKEWNRMAPLLEKLGLLTEIDHGMFEAMCIAYSDWVKYSKQARERPLIKSQNSNYVQISPFITLAQNALKNYLKIAAEFGLSPSSRSNLKVEQPKRKSKAEEFMNRKKGMK